MAPVKADPAKAPETPQNEGAERAMERKAQSRAGSYDISIYDAWCKQCGLCVAFCPKAVLTSDTFGNPEATFPEKCIGCMLCVLHCPDFAIDVTEKEENGEKPEV